MTTFNNCIELSGKWVDGGKQKFKKTTKQPLKEKTKAAQHSF